MTLRRRLKVLLAFAVAGTVAVGVARVLLGDVLGIEGSLWSGPWTFRAAYVATVPPLYWLTLVLVASALGERAYFVGRLRRTWSRTRAVGSGVHGGRVEESSGNR